jgi:hypothetical protein
MRWPCTEDDECRRVDVFDAGIVPGGLYNVQFIDCDENCSITNEEDYSDALPVQMSEAGDVIGFACLPAPEGAVSFVDIMCVVSKFKNEHGAIRKARADIVGTGGPFDPLPNQKVDFVDVSCAAGAFRGYPCVPVGPPMDDPCPSTLTACGGR